MLRDISAALHRSRATLLSDIAGGTALVSLLVVGLHLPSILPLMA